MSLRIFSASGSRIIERAHFFRVRHDPYVSPQPETAIFCGWDLFLMAMYNVVFYMPMEPCSLRSAYNFDIGEPATSRTHFYKVDKVPKSSRRDAEVYGNISRNLSFAASLLAGKSLKTASLKGENQCYHAMFKGTFLPRLSGTPVTKQLFDPYGSGGREVTRLNGEVFDTVFVTSVDPFTISYSPVGSSNQHWLFTEVGDFLREGATFDVHTDPTSVVHLSLSNFDWKVVVGHLVVGWHNHMQIESSSQPQYFYAWDAGFDIDLTASTIAGVRHPALGVGYDLGDNVGMQTHFEHFVSDNPNIDPMHASGVSYYGYSKPYALSFSTAPNQSGFIDDLGMSVTRRSPLRHLRDAISKEYSQIVPSSYFSTIDAFQSFEGYLGTNILQNLAKLPDILSALPQLGVALQTLKSLYRGDFSLLTLRKILDLSTSTILQANFQWAPFHRVLTNYLPKMYQMLIDFRNSAKVIGYGSRTFKLSNVLSRETVDLTVRTKMVLDISPSGLLSGILGVDALGLLPKPSNVWDLIPFTFVVNWFTGVGEALRRAEYAAFMATCPGYYVHTYTITSPLTDAEYEALETSPSALDPVTLRVFIRDVSLYTPLPRDSKFGFGLPSKTPPFGVIGSLLYQLFR